MTLKDWQLKFLESINGWDEFCVTSSDIVAQKKQKLLEMARNGEPRPNQKHTLRVSLRHYTNSKTDCYDLYFDKEIRELRPDWFMSRADIASQKKKQLLEMANNGESRPNKKHILGATLCSYTNQTHGCYDPEFDRQIRKLRPDWFVYKSDFANQKKQQLLEMANNGEPRPNKKNLLGSILINYTNSTNGCYDKNFDRQIRKLRPDWFVSRSDIANQKKQQLLDMAKNGDLKPSQKTNPLGYAFNHYTNPKNLCYDPDFCEKIRTLRPDWLASRSDISNQKKQRLLEMAKNGESRPNNKKHILGGVLSLYTNSKSEYYDQNFYKKVKAIRPDWFVSISDVANEKKQLLLEIAMNGDPRPSQRTHELGTVLSSYTNNSNNTSYDLDFDQQIRALRPDWFVLSSDVANEKKRQLLEIAKNGEAKPVAHKHTLAQVFSFYTSYKSGCYDSEFEKQIRELRPDWFMSKLDVANQKKQRLLEMAKNGESRPNQRTHELGVVLSNYTNDSNRSYDKNFDGQIRKLRPDWF